MLKDLLETASSSQNFFLGQSSASTQDLGVANCESMSAFGPAAF